MLDSLRILVVQNHYIGFGGDDVDIMILDNENA